MTTAYVDGLPFDWDEAKISNFFGNCGVIVRVKAPTWHDSGRLKGYALIEFKNEDGLEAALKLDKAKVSESRYVSVAKATSEPGRAAKPRENLEPADPDCKTLYLGNLPYDAKEDEVFQLLRKAGPIASVRIVTENGRSKGFAYVDFKAPDSLRRLLATDTTLAIRGRKLVVDSGRGKAKEGFHYRKEAFDAKSILPPKKKRPGVKKLPSL